MPEDAQTGPPGLKVRVVDIEADEIRNFQVPAFVNYVNVWRLGSDVYVDMGLVTVEDLGALKPDIGQATVAIYDRFVMSPIRNWLLGETGSAVTRLMDPPRIGPPGVCDLLNGHTCKRIRCSSA